MSPISSSVPSVRMDNVSIPQIVSNDFVVYPGNLKGYFKVVFNNARNLFNPYHNFRHLFDVLWKCHDACRFYNEKLPPSVRRNLLIAAMFHDFDHSGRVGSDDLEIQRALRGLKKHILPEDSAAFEAIAAMIQATEFPYKVSSEGLPLALQILRDADLSQVFSTAWIQQVVFGLSAEMGVTPMEILKMQGGFLGHLKFSTEWATVRFGENAIQSKMKEAEAMISFLE